MVIVPFLYLKSCLQSKSPGTMDEIRKYCMGNVFFHKMLFFASERNLNANQGPHLISLKRVTGFTV